MTSSGLWSSCWERVLVLLVLYHALPAQPRLAPHPALATSLQLLVSSSVPAGDIRLYEAHTVTVRFHYTLNVTGEANHTLALAICVTVDQAEIAVASVSQASILPLQTDSGGAFNVTVRGLLLGRAALHVYFVVGVSGVTCGQPGADDLQDLLRVSETADTREFAWNLSSSSSSSPPDSSPALSTSSVGMHTGRQYEVVVLRQERVIDTVFTVGIIIFVVIINIGMGCELDIAVVKATLRRPFAPVTGFLSQFLIMPAVGLPIHQCNILRRHYTRTAKLSVSQ